MTTILPRWTGVLMVSLGVFFATGSALAQAPAMQTAAAIQQSVDQYMRQQTSSMPGKVTYTIGGIDPRLVLPACGNLDIFLPAGARLWGQSNLGVRCGGPTQWTIYVGVDVRISGHYLAASRAIAPGQVLTSGDLTVQSGDLTLLPQGVLSNQESAIGRIAVASITAGQALRYDQLRAPLAVQQGQSVKILSGGNGFRVSAEGRALNNAQEGQVTQVRTGGGQTISGVARAGGTVEVTF